MTNAPDRPQRARPWVQLLFVLILSLAACDAQPEQAARPEVHILFPPPDTLVTEPITLRAEVGGPQPVAEVSLLLDGEPLATSTQPPFDFYWDESARRPVETWAAREAHTLTVRATDTTRNVGEARVAVTLVRPTSGVVADVIPAGHGHEQILIRLHFRKAVWVTSVDVRRDGGIVYSASSARGYAAGTTAVFPPPESGDALDIVPGNWAVWVSGHTQEGFALAFADTLTVTL